jgi:hypothetical protein
MSAGVQLIQTGRDGSFPLHCVSKVGGGSSASDYDGWDGSAPHESQLSQGGGTD